MNKSTKSEKKDGLREQQERWDRFKEISTERHVTIDHKLWDNLYYVTKIAFSVLLLLAILTCAIISKGALLVLSWNLFTPYTPSSTGNKLKTLDGNLIYTGNVPIAAASGGTFTDLYYIWALFMMLVTPNFLTIVFYFLRIVFKGRPKFRFRALLFALLISSLHTVGLTIFVFSLLPTLDPFCGLLYCSSVTFLPSLIQVVFYGDKKKTKPRALFILTLISIVFFIISVTFWTVYVAVGAQPSLAANQIALYAICPFLVSFGWLENLLPNARIESSHDSDDAGEADTSSSTRLSSKIMEYAYSLTRDLYESRYVTYLVVNTWKIVLTFLLILAIFGEACDKKGVCLDVLLGRNTTDAAVQLTSKAFGNTWLAYGITCRKEVPFIVAGVGMAASFLAHRLCVAALKIVAQIVSYYVPLMAATPATFITVVIVLVVTKHHDPSMCNLPFPRWDGGTEIGHWWFAMLGAIFGYASMIFATTFIWTNDIERMEREDRLFFKPLYCGALFDQSMLLGRQREYKKPKTEREAKQENEVDEKFDIPMLYLCATMWHETESEMTQILTSLFRMDIDQCVRKITHAGDGDYYNFEAHILFDDAFRKDSTCAGEYVELFARVIMKAASEFYPKKFPLKSPMNYVTPYGGRMVYTLPGENCIVVHLKDKSKIRNKKRWSQVMYMYYFLAHKLEDEYKEPKDIQRRAKNTFILALDGDVDFRPPAVKVLVDRMKRNPIVGAACGRIHPIGSGPMVWYQKFEYAVSHWLIKATEHVTGCVLCSPGCFSLFRGSALMEVNVMKKYTMMPCEARHHVQYDQGEDRWLCTLLLKQGKKIDYCAASDAYTFAPEGFKEFFKQRRRWTPSTMANILEILQDWKDVTKKNSNMSFPYIALQTMWFFSSVVTPGVLFLMIVGAVNLAYPALSLTASLLINLGVLTLFVLLCFFATEKHQLNFAAALSLLYAVVMMIVLVGLVRQSAQAGICSVTPIFSIFVVGVFVIAGISHPKEFGCLLYGPLFFIAIPSMSMLLLIYSIINLNNVSWGTREAAKPQEAGQKATGGPKRTAKNILDKLRLSCKCCTETNKVSEKEGDIVQTLQEINARLDTIEGCIVQGRKKEVEVWAAPTTPRVFPAQKEKLVIPEKGLLNFKEYEKLPEMEQKFWEWLIETYLFPLDAKKEKADSGAPTVDKAVDMKEELRKFRNKASLAFLLMNALFITIIFFLQLANEQTNGQISVQITCSNGDKLNVEPISVSFTLVFGILLGISFICMLQHRWKTFLQINSIVTFRREIDIEQLLFDAFEDVVGDKKKKEAKAYTFSAKASKSKTFRQWLFEALKEMAEVVESEEFARDPTSRPGTSFGTRAFKERVKRIRAIEKSVKSMKTTQLRTLRECIEKAVKHHRETQPPKPLGFGSAAMMLLTDRRKERKQVEIIQVHETNANEEIKLNGMVPTSERKTGRVEPEVEIMEHEDTDLQMPDGETSIK